MHAKKGFSGFWKSPFRIFTEIKFQMIKSMTGYGKAVCELPSKKITVEVRSLNSKTFDLSMRIPSLYREKEPELRSDIAKQLERGKIDFSIYSEFIGEAASVTINRTLARSYYNELKGLATELHETGSDLLALTMKMPEVMRAERQELDENEWKQLRASVDLALKEFQRFRSDEGKTQADDFEKRIGFITTSLAEVEKADALRVNTVRERIRKNIAEFVEKEKIDQNRFEQELIYYIEKIDITEEKVRLKTHCEYFLKTMSEDNSGRKLGFITQEIGREINTIGSKANDAVIQKIVVQMKDELEKIKEQVSNVL
jgi:uncharacterized protein (TIGR00255 family)